MRNFWILFIVLLVSGTAAIYYYAPFYSSSLTPFVPAWMRPADPASVSTTYITNRVLATTLPRESVPKTPQKKKELLPEDEAFVSPALEGIYYARSSEHPGWGVTHQKTAYYNGKGAYLGTIESGELLTCLAGKLTSSKGDLLECQVSRDTSSTLFIARKDAHFFSGDYNKLAEQQLHMLSTYYQLSGKITERRKKLLEDSANLNPYFQSSKTAYAALTKNIEEANELHQQLASATDFKKAALDDQLRTLKMKEVVLRKTFESVQKDFVDWKTRHAEQLPRPETDPETKAWLAEKQKLASSLPGLAF